MTRGFLPLLMLVLAGGSAALAWETDNFRAFTSMGAQQLEIERNPRPLPDVQLVDQDGNAFALSAYKGRTVLIDFIYTSCPTICGILGDDLARVKDRDSDKTQGTPVDLLSISFDPQNDGRESLKLYGDRFGAAAPTWRIATTTNVNALTALLEAFGVVIIPDGMGGFTHTSAVYVVDARGRLARMLDPDSPPQRVAAALRTATP
jgi:protein SCO1